MIHHRAGMNGPPSPDQCDRTTGRRGGDEVRDFRYPLLQATSRLPGLTVDAFRSIHLLAVLHFLPNLPVFLASSESLGLDPRSCTLLHKAYPYAEKAEVRSRLEARGYRVRPLEELETAAQEAVAAASKTGRRILILEDGGYFTRHLHRMGPTATESVIGSVEQTTAGIRIVEELHQSGLRFPVIDIARSALKSRHEPAYVARSAIQNIQNLLPERILCGQRVTVIGYGAVGRALSIEARRHGMIVTVFDESEHQLALAFSEGMQPIPSLPMALDGVQLVFGTTGTTSVGETALSFLEHGSVLVSTSSGRHEFDLDALGAHAHRVRRNRDHTDYWLEPDLRHIRVLAHGYPVNFHGFTAVPGQIIDLVLTAMFAASHELVASGPHPPTIVSADELISRFEIEERFFRVHGTR